MYYEVNVLIVLTDVDVTVTTSKTVRQSLDEDAPGDEFGVMEQSHTILLCSLSHAVNTWHSSTTPTARVFSWPKPNLLLKCNTTAPNVRGIAVVTRVLKSKTAMSNDWPSI